MTPAARLAAWLLVLAWPGSTALAGPAPDDAPRDPDFGVVADGAIGLERRVEMFQWQRHGSGYRAGWSADAVDSADFAAGHENPPEVPLRSRRWIPRRLLLDDRPVAPQAVEALARWRVLRPDFSALPGNLSATFQPEGDGLGSAANPVHPEVGDLRITWRELRMPASYDGLVLRDGRWHPDARIVGADARAGTATPGTDGASAQEGRATFRWIMLGAVAAGLAAAVFMLRRRRRDGGGAR